MLYNTQSGNEENNIEETGYTFISTRLGLFHEHCLFKLFIYIEISFYKNSK